MHYIIRAEAVETITVEFQFYFIFYIVLKGYKKSYIKRVMIDFKISRFNESAMGIQINGDGDVYNLRS